MRVKRYFAPHLWWIRVLLIICLSFFIFWRSYVLLKGIKNFLSDLYHNRIAILCIIIYMSVTQYLFHSVCPIAILFGFPCPACGLTRAGISFLTAHFSTAFQMNPCIFLLIPYFLYLWFYKYIFEKKPPYLTFITCLLGIIVFGIYILRLLTHTLPELPTNGIIINPWQSDVLPDYQGFIIFSNPLCKAIQFILH